MKYTLRLSQQRGQKCGAEVRKRPGAPKCSLCLRAATQSSWGGTRRQTAAGSWDFSKIGYRIPKLWLHKVSMRHNLSQSDKQRRRQTFKMHNSGQQHMRISSRRKHVMSCHVTLSVAMHTSRLTGPLSSIKRWLRIGIWKSCRMTSRSNLWEHGCLWIPGSSCKMVLRPRC
jgi:hypothetical protein